MRLFLKDADKETATEAKNYQVQKSTKFGVTPVIITAVLGQIKGGLDEPNPEWLGAVPPDQAKKISKVWKEIEADWKVHSKNRAEFDKNELQAKVDAKARRDAEALAKQEDAKESREMMASAGADAGKSLAKTSGLVDSTMVSFLGDKFMISGKSGMVAIKKGAELTKADFAEVLAKFDTFDQYTEAVRSEASAREAQVALLAKQKLGDTWKALYAERPRALARVAKYTKVFEDLKVLGKPIYGPVNNMRKAQEVRVASPATNSDEDKAAANAKNMEAKGKIIDQVIALQTKEKRNATQAEITAIVNSVKSSYGVKKVPKPQCIYVILDDEGKPFTVAGALKDPRLMAVMVFCITNKMTKEIVKEGVPVEVNVKAPNDAKNAYIDKLIKEMTGGEPDEPPVVVNGKTAKSSVTETPKGKAKKASATPAPKEEEEEEEEPAEEEEEEETTETEETEETEETAGEEEEEEETSEEEEE